MPHKALSGHQITMTQNCDEYLQVFRYFPQELSPHQYEDTTSNTNFEQQASIFLNFQRCPFMNYKAATTLPTSTAIKCVSTLSRSVRTLLRASKAMNCVPAINTMRPILYCTIVSAQQKLAVSLSDQPSQAAARGAAEGCCTDNQYYPYFF